jgi:hypothetical protein
MAGMCRQNHFRWAWESPRYAEAFKAAREVAVDRLVGEAHRRAMSGSDALLRFLLKAARPEVYGNRCAPKYPGAGDAPPIQAGGMTDGQRDRAARVAAALQRIPGLDVEAVDGNKGEFTVLMNGREVARKREELPSVEEVVAAVKDRALTK